MAQELEDNGTYIIRNNQYYIQDPCNIQSAITTDQGMQTKWAFRNLNNYNSNGTYYLGFQSDRDIPQNLVSVPNASPWLILNIPDSESQKAIGVWADGAIYNSTVLSYSEPRITLDKPDNTDSSFGPIPNIWYFDVFLIILHIYCYELLKPISKLIHKF